MTQEVIDAVAEIRAAFPGSDVEEAPEGQGGAYVLVRDLDLGPQYSPRKSWAGFLISFQYPYADVYPHFVDGNLERSDGLPLGQAFQKVSWRGRPATQISRRSNHWAVGTDTAALKLAKVLEWIRSQ